jgi:hypothetical protein
MYQASTGAVWTIIPEYGITCRDTPAYRIVEFNVDRQTKCTLGSWAPSNAYEGTKPGFDGHAAYGPVTIGVSCGFLGLGSITWRAWASWKIDSSEQWQFCNKALQPSRLVRKGPNGEIDETIQFKNILTVDPTAMGRPYGWYTSGDKEVIVYSSYDEGKSGHLLFFTPDNWTNYMQQYHFHPGYDNVNIIPPNGVGVQPNTLQCKVHVTIPNGNEFTEFQQPCEGVWATQNDDPTAGIKILTLSELWCTVDVGFGDENMTTVIAINLRSPVTLKGADRWRCTTENQYGTKCSSTHSYEMFNPEIVNASLRTQITTLSAEVEGNYHDISLENPFDFFDFASMKDTISTIAIALVIVLVLVALAFIIYKIVKARCRKRKENRLEIGLQDLEQEPSKG